MEALLCWTGAAAQPGVCYRRQAGRAQVAQLQRWLRLLDQWLHMQEKRHKGSESLSGAACAGQEGHENTLHTVLPGRMPCCQTTIEDNSGS